MARYSDEAWDMIEDSRDKKVTAQSARSRRGHCGRRGGVKLPSDSLSAREKKALNGECETYRLNAPMTWAEFVEMPNDLQKEYIRKIQKKYNIPSRQLAGAMNVYFATFEQHMRNLRIGFEDNSNANERWIGSKEQKAFTAWWNPAQVTFSVED